MSVELKLTIRLDDDNQAHIKVDLVEASEGWPKLTAVQASFLNGALRGIQGYVDMHIPAVEAAWDAMDTENQAVRPMP